MAGSMGPDPDLHLPILQHLKLDEVNGLQRFAPLLQQSARMAVTPAQCDQSLLGQSDVALHPTRKVRCLSNPSSRIYWRFIHGRNT